MNNLRTRVDSLTLGWGLTALVLGLHFYARYLPSPWAVFVGDDWANYARSLSYSGAWEAFVTGWQDSRRPFSLALTETFYHVTGLNAWPWTLLSIAAHSIFLYIIMRLMLALSGRRHVALIGGIIFALLPNLTETHHWSTLALSGTACAGIAYALSAWGWVQYVRGNNPWCLAGSVLAYAVGVFSYEIGILLPASYLVLLSWRSRPMRNLLRLAPFGGVVVAYALWRVTDSFGINEIWHYPSHMEAGLSLWGLSWNARQIIHWWIGDHLFGHLLAGWESFATLSPWTRRWLALGGAAVASMLCLVVLRRSEQQDLSALPDPDSFTARQQMSFALVFTLAPFAICLVSYTASRLMMLPAVGLSLLAALWLGGRPRKSLWALGILPMGLCLLSTQGTAESYRQAGEMNQRVYTHLARTQHDWSGKQVLLFDTHSMRQRLTPGLLTPVGNDPATWAEYGNAPLFRGFVPGGMIRILGGKAHVVHDVEHGAHIEGDTLVWHERYDPTQPRATPMSDVYVVDVQQVAGEGF